MSSTSLNTSTIQIDPITAGIAVASGVSTLLTFHYLKSRIQKLLVDRLTALNDIPNLGSPRRGKKINRTAIICGGGIAGLWAARVCADHFEDVLIIEPEAWLADEDGRKPIFDENGDIDTSIEVHNRSRVMQYGAIHGFQPFTSIALKKLYPNVEELYRKSGAAITFPSFNIHFNGIPFDKFPYEAYPNGEYPLVPNATRDTFEKVLRKLIYEPGGRIRWLVGTVTGIQSSTEKEKELNAQSASVRIKETKEELIIPASLIIDCSGTSQAGLKWIKRLQTDKGLLSPSDPDSDSKHDIDSHRVTYDPKMYYTTYRIPIPTEMRERLPIPGGYEPAKGFLYAFVPQPPDECRTITLVLVEGHRIDIGLGAWGDPNSPKTLSGVISWAKTFNATRPIPDWVFETLDILQEVEHQGTCADLLLPPCSWIHYENITNLPSNYIAIGDAQMRLNPIFGQGCSKALLGALTLDNILRTIPEAEEHIPSDFSTRFFKLHSSRVGHLWNGTKPTDYGWDTTIPSKGETLKDGWFSRKYSELLTALILRDDKMINSAAWHVRNFLAPPTDVFHPLIVTKIIVFAARRVLGLV